MKHPIIFRLLPILIASLIPLSMTPALAHDGCDAHDEEHDQLDGEHAQIHDLVNEGAISPEEHAALDARLRAQHRAFHQASNGYGYNNGYGYGYPRYSNGYGYGYNNGYNNGWFNPGNAHRAEHAAFNDQHRDIHRLVRQGLISPQEHASLDAQLELQHEQQDADNGWLNPNAFSPLRQWFGQF